MAALAIEEFTDPGCPFAFSAEPARWRVEWLYGDQIDWSRRMVVLSESPEDYDNRGFTPDEQADSYRRLRREHGMPTVCQLELEDGREELARVAEHQPVGNDGYWALRVAEPAGA